MPPRAYRISLVWLRRHRNAVIWALAAIAVFLFAVGTYRAAVSTPHGGSDFDGFYNAVVDYRNIEGHISTNISRYPPTFLVLLFPLTFLPLWLASAIWIAANVGAAALTPRALYRLSGVRPLRQWPAWLLIAPFLADNIVLGQSGPILLFLVVQGLALARTNRAYPGGVLIGVSGLIKVIPAIFAWIPIILNRTRRTVAAGLGTGIAAALITIALLGPRDAWHMTSTWANELRTNQTQIALVEQGRTLRYSNQGVGVTLARTFGDVTSPDLRGSVRISALPLTPIWVVVFTVQGAVVLCWLLMGWRSRRRPEDPDVWLGLTVLTAGVMLAISPIVWEHYFYFLLPAYVFLLRRFPVLVAAGVAGIVALAVIPLRGLGMNTWIALTIFGFVTRSLFLSLSARRSPG